MNLAVLKHKIIILLASLTGCVHCGAPPVTFDPTPSTQVNRCLPDGTVIDYSTLFDPTNFMYRNNSVPFNGKRLFMFASSTTLQGTNTGDVQTGLFNVPGYDNFVQSLLNDGWQVVLFNVPPLYKGIKAFWNQDGGIQYAIAFKAKMLQAIQWADSNYSKAALTIVGGISYGGLHSLMAQALLPNLIDGYFGILPVIAVGALGEYDGCSAPNFNPLNRESILATKSGFLMWNTTDIRVDFNFTVTLNNDLLRMGADVNSIFFTSGGHTMPNDDISSVYNWIKGTF